MDRLNAAIQQERTFATLTALFDLTVCAKAGYSVATRDRQSEVASYVTKILANPEPDMISPGFCDYVGVAELEQVATLSAFCSNG